MNTKELKRLIDKYFVGQGSQIDLGGKLPCILHSMLNINDTKASIEEIDRFDDFSEEKPYKAKDIVRYDGNLYKFTADHTGPWSDADVEQTTIYELVFPTLEQGYLQGGKFYRTKKTYRYDGGTITWDGDTETTPSAVISTTTVYKIADTIDNHFLKGAAFAMNNGNEYTADYEYDGPNYSMFTPFFVNYTIYNVPEDYEDSGRVVPAGIYVTKDSVYISSIVPKETYAEYSDEEAFENTKIYWDKDDNRTYVFKHEVSDTLELTLPYSGEDLGDFGHSQHCTDILLKDDNVDALLGAMVTLSGPYAQSGPITKVERDTVWGSDGYMITVQNGSYPFFYVPEGKAKKQGFYISYYLNITRIVANSSVFLNNSIVMIADNPQNNATKDEVGDLSELATDHKSNLVNAINELAGLIETTHFIISFSKTAAELKEVYDACAENIVLAKNIVFYNATDQLYYKVNGYAMVGGVLKLHTIMQGDSGLEDTVVNLSSNGTLSVE